MKRCKNNKDEEEHVNATLHTGNQLKISIKEFSWGTEDNALMLNTSNMQADGETDFG